MRSALLLAVAAPALVAAGPPTAPKITELSFSGTACPQNSASAKISSDTLGDWVTVNFGQLKGVDSENCQAHLQANGATQGWQFAIKEVIYRGDLTLKSGSQLDTITTAYFSQDASSSTVLRGQLACAGPDYNSAFTLKSTSSDPAFSPCTGSNGYVGILNVNHRPVINGNAGTFNIKSAQWHLEWRKC